METKTYTGTGGDIIVLGQDPGTIECVTLDGAIIEGASSSLLNGTDDVFCLLRPHSSNDGIWQAGSVVEVTADWIAKPKEPIVELVPVVEETPIPIEPVVEPVAAA